MATSEPLEDIPEEGPPECHWAECQAILSNTESLREHVLVEHLDYTSIQLPFTLPRRSRVCTDLGAMLLPSITKIDNELFQICDQMDEIQREMTMIRLMFQVSKRVSSNIDTDGNPNFDHDTDDQSVTRQPVGGEVVKAASENAECTTLPNPPPKYT
jgi:hypothetical protein